MQQPNWKLPILACHREPGSRSLSVLVAMDGLSGGVCPSRIKMCPARDVNGISLTKHHSSHLLDEEDSVNEIVRLKMLWDIKDCSALRRWRLECWLRET